jgi:hypothetical protein
MFLEERPDGEPQRRWPEWYVFVPAIYHETDFLKPYSYVVLPCVD